MFATSTARLTCSGNAIMSRASATLATARSVAMACHSSWVSVVFGSLIARDMQPRDWPFASDQPPSPSAFRTKATDLRTPISSGSSGQFTPQSS